MKIMAIDTFPLRIPTQKPIALDLPEHRLVVTRVRTDAGLEGLGYSLVFGGAGSEAVEAYARRLAGLLVGEDPTQVGDRKSTRLNSSHGYISYAVFCLKKKN